MKRFIFFNADNNDYQIRKEKMKIYNHYREILLTTGLNLSLREI